MKRPASAKAGCRAATSKIIRSCMVTPSELKGSRDIEKLQRLTDILRVKSPHLDVPETLPNQMGIFFQKLLTRGYSNQSRKSLADQVGLDWRTMKQYEQFLAEILIRTDLSNRSTAEAAHALDDENENLQYMELASSDETPMEVQKRDDGILSLEVIKSELSTSFFIFDGRSHNCRYGCRQE